MCDENNSEKIILPHHEAQSLCTSRLPYRQGRKLTAVKVYTVNSESNHLLVFGVPSLNLRKETKSLFKPFGKLLQFALTTTYPAESFTENYHVIFENIQSARIAKKMLDTKNFYGGSLHICYAPELEDINETRAKIFKRQRDVLNRLKNLKKDECCKTTVRNLNADNKITTVEERSSLKPKINMGEHNVLKFNQDNKEYNFKNKRKLPHQTVVIKKQFKPCFEIATTSNKSSENIVTLSDSEKLLKNHSESEIEVIDFTSTEQETLSNIDESLNYNNFGNEMIKKVPPKPVNRIKFIVGNKR